MNLSIITDASLPMARRVDSAIVQSAMGRDLADQMKFELAVESLLADIDATEELAQAALSLESDDWSDVDENGVPVAANMFEMALRRYKAPRTKGVTV